MTQAQPFSVQITAARQLAENIAPVWLDAVIAAEDPNHRKRALGGSAITAHAAGLLVREADPSLSRSKANAKRMQTTLALAAAASEDDIICIVLLHAPFGLGTVGHDTAARRFFRKGANELTLAQVAFLAGLIEDSSILMSDPGKALDRRNLVLRGMHAAGAISAEELQTALAEPIDLPR